MDTEVNKFLRNWCDCWLFPRHLDILRFNGKLNPQNFDVQKWLQIFSTDGYRQSKDWRDLEYKKEKRRGLKILPKLAKNVSFERGYLVASVFMNISVVRDNVITEILDGRKEMDDFSSNPYDYDYGISPDDIQKTLKDVYKKPKRVPFFAITRDSAGHPIECPQCNGEGSIKCRKCKGSGREKYVDGNFASGEERMKTGQCSKCQGKGTLKCKECAGSGKRQILSNQYQITKSFDDVKKISGLVAYSLSSNPLEECDGEPGQYFPIIEDDDSAYYEEYGYGDAIRQLFGNHSEYGKVWLNFENKSLKSGIYQLHKNQKELIIDGNKTLPDGLEEVCERLFEKNKRKALAHFEKEDEQGKLACSVENHLVIPFISILFEYNNDTYNFDLFEMEDGKIKCDYYHGPELSFFKSLFI